MAPLSEGPSTDPPEPSEPSTSNGSSTGGTLSPPTSPASYSSSSSETPPRRLRLVEDIYASCNLALLALDPLYYEDAAGSQAKHHFFRLQMGVTNI
ncbi:hypothetical protein BVRB_6g146550 [Beta vulgaris subsp. vulgaris]|nr:hypothetical protein BVRB_6g146550 [Beta vulgaris subsp. vulgaris]